MTSYKQALIVVMENGALIHWSGYAEDRNHAEGLAIEYAKDINGGQVWDTAFYPVIEKESI